MLKLIRPILLFMIIFSDIDAMEMFSNEINKKSEFNKENNLQGILFREADEAISDLIDELNDSKSRIKKLTEKNKELDQITEDLLIELESKKEIDNNGQANKKLPSYRNHFLVSSMIAGLSTFTLIYKIISKGMPIYRSKYKKNKQFHKYFNFQKT